MCLDHVALKALRGLETPRPLQQKASRLLIGNPPLTNALHVERVQLSADRVFRKRPFYSQHYVVYYCLIRVL